MNRESFLDRMDRKFGKYAIRNLISIIVGGMLIVYLFDMIFYAMNGISIMPYLIFDKAAILHGQIWRIFTFIFIPPNSSIFFILFSLYFYHIIGVGLEKEWGAFRLNLYYLVGILGTAVAGLITGYATNSYLNLTLFLAFAILYPDYPVAVFFIPTKMKYLAIVDLVLLAFSFIRDSWSGRLALLVALANIVLFFWHDFADKIKMAKRRREWQQNFKN